MKKLSAFILFAFIMMSCTQNSTDNNNTIDLEKLPHYPDPAKHKQDVFAFDVAIQWNGEIIQEGEEEGIDNETQYFSVNGDYLGMTMHGDGFQIMDFDKNLHYSIYDEVSTKTEMKKGESSDIKLTSTDERKEIGGYETIKYTWKDEKGNSGAVWYSTQLKFPATNKGYLSPADCSIPLAPKSANLGVPLKVKKEMSNGIVYDFEVSQVIKIGEDQRVRDFSSIKSYSSEKCCYTY